MSKCSNALFVWAVVGLSALLLSACAANGVTASRPLPANVLVWESLPHSAEALMEPDLKKAFESYWTHYYWRDSESRYALELGAFRKRYDSEFYKNYYHNAWPVKEIVVQDVTNPEIGGGSFNSYYHNAWPAKEFVAQEATNQEIGRVVGFKLKMVQKKSSAGEERVNAFWDVWVQEEGVWYHKHYDPVLQY